MAPENNDTADRERILPPNFIWDQIDEHNQSGRFDGRVHTRFPPEPNGRLHIGHAKAICINFGTALAYGGTCNLRMDDTNPTKEETHFVEAIQDDIRWLGFEWQEPMFYASDYFDKLYDFAVELIEKGKAYVCDLTPDEMRTYRGTLTEPGKDSPYRERSVAENLDLFQRMRAGEFDEGSRTLRAKIDMASPNIAMRDPVIYRILKADHHRTGGKWCIYPMYDFTHCISDSLEGITHSLCSLEFENNRPLYDWFLDELDLYHPQQIEFARLNLTYTVMSKRWFAKLVDEGYVDGWNDPRMPTLAGLRRRGVPPEALRNFIADVGVAKSNSMVDVGLLEHHMRQHLNQHAPRVMGVLNPLKVVITNYPDGQSEELEAINNPEDASAGTRPVTFSRELYIEREDFMENPPRRFYRLSPGTEVRLRYAYFITCDEVIKDEQGEVVELLCSYDPATRGGDAPDGRRPKATLHWVSAPHALEAEVRLYDRLFSVENPHDVDEGGSLTDNLNPESLTVLPSCYVEASLANAQPGYSVQFERQGYFCVDPSSTADKLVFNRTVSLRDTWARIQERGKK